MKKISHWKDLLATFIIIVGAVLFFPQIIGTNDVVFGYGGNAFFSPPLSPSPTLTVPINLLTDPQVVLPEPVKSSTKEILSFSIPRQVNETVIDNDARTIDIIMPFGTDVTALTPNITTNGVLLSPANGQAQNFVYSKTYTVKAEDGSSQMYTVRVMVTSRVPRTDESEWFEKDVKRTDILRDGVIDVLDFNTLMVNWGKPTVSGASFNPADVNEDKKVDIFDFNYVMVHWGKIEP